MLKEIQYLRAVAVLMVVWVHATFLPVATKAFLKMVHLKKIATMPYFGSYFVAMAGVGVDMFFVISGYVVSASLFRSLIIDEQANFITNLENNVCRLKAFFVRRFFRLFPVAVLLIIVQTPGIWIWPSWFQGTNVTEQLMDLLSHITMQSDIDTITFSKQGNHFRMVNHYWSLAVEERFYLIIPFIILLCRNPSRFMTAAVATIIGIMLVRGLYPIEGPSQYLNGFLRLDSFMFGILIYLLQTYTSVFRKLFTRRYSKTCMNLVALLLVLILARLPISQVNGPELSDIIHYTEYYYYYFSVYMLSTILIALASQDEGYVLDIPGIRCVLEWVGNRSYIIYVFQFWYMFVAYKIAEYYHIGGERAMVLSLIFAAVTFVISEVIARVVEIPFRRFGKRLAGRIVIEAGETELLESSAVS